MKKMSNSAKIIIGFSIIAVLSIAVVIGWQVILHFNGKAQQLYLGNICTMNEEQPYVEAVAVRDGKIQYVGNVEEAMSYCDDKTEVFNYNDKFIYPGFLDAHAHTMFAGYRAIGQANVTQVVPADAEQYKTIIKEFIEKHPEKEIYIATGWTEDKNPAINSSLLDEICPNKPLLLNTGSGHSALLNKKAMELFGVDVEYAKKWGPELVHVDASGNPDGYICENPAIKILSSIEVSVSDAKEYLLNFQDYAFANGYTAVSDAGTELMSKNATTAHEELQDENKLKMRTYAYLMVADNVDDPKARIEQIAKYAQEHDGEYYNVVGAKVFLDGVLEAHTSWLTSDYLDQAGYHGLERFNNKDKMIELIAEAGRHNLAVHSHSEGDGATKFFLDCIEEAQKISGNKDQRNALAHLHFVRQEDIQRFSSTNSIAVVPPLWSPKNPVAYDTEVKSVGADKVDSSYPIKSFYDAGVIAAFHTDYPVSPSFNGPMSVYTAVTRSIPSGIVEGIGGPDSVSNSKEVITRQQALAGLTKNVAYMWHQEDKLGTLEVGKIANMTIVDTDLINEDVNMLPLAQIVATVVDGHEVYNSADDPDAKYRKQSPQDYIKNFFYSQKYDWDDTVDWYAMLEE